MYAFLFVYELRSFDNFLPSLMSGSKRSVGLVVKFNVSNFLTTLSTKREHLAKNSGILIKHSRLFFFCFISFLLS